VLVTTLPRVAPLILKSRAAAFDNDVWLFELKYGFRALLEIDAAGARLVSHSWNRFKHLDPLAAALAKRLRVLTRSSMARSSAPTTRGT